MEIVMMHFKMRLDYYSISQLINFDTYLHDLCGCTKPEFFIQMLKETLTKSDNLTIPETLSSLVHLIFFGL